MCDVSGHSEAITEGDSMEDASVQARDCLLTALAGYLSSNRDLPVPSPAKRRQQLVELRPLHSAKLALYQAMRDEGLTRVAFAKPN